MDWKNEINKICLAMIEKHKLPANSLYLAENMGKEGKLADNREEVISYSVCIYEPEFPEVKRAVEDLRRNTVVMNIKFNELKTKTWVQILVRDSATEFIGGLEGAEDKGSVAKTYSHKYQFDNKNMNNMLPIWMKYLEDVIEYELRNYTSKAAPFGCCSRFVECSDEKECVHENKLYACACYYKHNLDNGKIFYGKNKNV